MITSFFYKFTVVIVMVQWPTPLLLTGRRRMFQIHQPRVKKHRNRRKFFAKVSGGDEFRGAHTMSGVLRKRAGNLWFQEITKSHIKEHIFQFGVSVGDVQSGTYKPYRYKPLLLSLLSRKYNYTREALCVRICAARISASKVRSCCVHMVSGPAVVSLDCSSGRW